MLYSEAHDTTPDRFDERTVSEILDACPDDGPAADVDEGSG
jgi:hypothetical protein